LLMISATSSLTRKEMVFIGYVLYKNNN
jgi:hypothetical protein